MFDIAPILIVIFPAGQLLDEQPVELPPMENVPAKHELQPSVLSLAPFTTTDAI